MTSALDRALDAIARGETSPEADPADRLLLDVASQVFRAARAIEPPPGAFGRAVAGAVLPMPPRPWTMRLVRPALAVALSVILVSGLGTAAFASTPGESLYLVQRRLDDIYLGVPRPPADAARAYRAVADRRVAQATGVADRVSPDLLRSVLDDVARYLRDARAAVQRSPAAERRELLRSVLETQRSAKTRLSQVGQQAGPDQRGQIGQFEESMQHEIDAEERELEQDNDSGSRPAVPSVGNGSVVPPTSGRSDGRSVGGEPVTPGDAPGAGAGSGANGGTAQNEGQSGSPGPDGASAAGGNAGTAGSSGNVGTGGGSGSAGSRGSDDGGTEP
ncbi:MAG: hypothetical protein NVS1B1_10890 [Candidatus Limnocylindrales bacterium]